MRAMGPRKRASTPSGGRSTLDRRRRPDNRLRNFDEADLDAALARFEELHPQAPRLENAASQVARAHPGALAARDWEP